MRIRIAFIVSLALIFSFDIFLTVIVGIARGVTSSALLALPESNRRAASDPPNRNRAGGAQKERQKKSTSIQGTSKVALRISLSDMSVPGCGRRASPGPNKHQTRAHGCQPNVGREI